MVSIFKSSYTKKNRLLIINSPKALRGLRLGPSKHLEEGMLVALVGLDVTDALSTTFMVIEQRQTTFAMRARTGNESRGQCSIP